MELSPKSAQASPSYPAHSPRLRRALLHARRLAVATTASLALSLSACYGATRMEPGDADPVTSDSGDAGFDGDSIIDPDSDVNDDASAPSRPISWCEPDYRLAGEETVPSLYFTCGHELPADAQTHQAPTWLMDGQLCGHQAAWAHVRVDEAFAGAVTFPYGTESASLRVYAPDGSLAVQLEPDRPCAAFDMEVGLWTLAVDALDPEGAGDAYFTLAFDSYYDPEW